jgi:hypothetical protein
MQEAVSGEGEHGLRLLTGHRRKPFKEFFEAVAGGGVVEEVFDRHTRAGEAGGAADAFAVDPDDAKEGAARLD